MDLDALRAFLAVAEHKSFTKAAEVLGGIRESTVSRQLTKLEEQLGVLLVTRGAGRYATVSTQLTAAGVELHSRAEQLMRNVEDAKHAVEAASNAQGGVLRVGYTSSHREPVVSAVAKIMTARPTAGTRITTRELSTSRIVADIRAGELDLGLAHSRTAARAIRSQVLPEAPLRLLANKAHPRLGRVSAVGRLEELASERFVLLRRSQGGKGVVEAYLDRMQFVPKVVVDATSTAFVLALVRSTDELLSLLPVPARYRKDLRGLHLVDLPEPEMQTTFLLWRGSRHRAPQGELAQLFVDVLRRHMDGSGS